MSFFTTEYTEFHGVFYSPSDAELFNFRKYNHLDLEELKELSLRFAPLGVRANSLVDDHVNHRRNYWL